MTGCWPIWLGYQLPGQSLAFQNLLSCLETKTIFLPRVYNFTWNLFNARIRCEYNLNSSVLERVNKIRFSKRKKNLNKQHFTNLVVLARGGRTIAIPSVAFKQCVRKWKFPYLRFSANWPMLMYNVENVIVTIVIIDHIPGLKTKTRRRMKKKKMIRTYKTFWKLLF